VGEQQTCGGTGHCDEEALRQQLPDQACTPAPMAMRMANSLWRAAPRASRRLARLAQAGHLVMAIASSAKGTTVAQSCQKSIAR
jgi:hypothetical protein